MAARLPIANRSGLEQCPEGFGVVAARFGYGLMVDLVVLPVFIILGGALFGWFGFWFHPRESKR